MLDDIFYLENRNVKDEELEVTEELKLRPGKKVIGTTNIRPLKHDLKRVV